MNHGPGFQALWSQLSRDVRDLQGKGYFGDGYWSSGTRIADSTRVGPQDLIEGDLPEYMVRAHILPRLRLIYVALQCGGAHNRARPTRQRRFRASGPSTSGRQTQRKRKPGTRVTAKSAFVGVGEGVTLSGAGEKDGFGRRAQSKRARAERAAAAERRLSALQGTKVEEGEGDRGNDRSSEEEGENHDIEEVVPETDTERRKTLMESMGEGDNSEELRSSNKWKQMRLDQFIFPPSQNGDGSSAGAGCDAMAIDIAGGTAASTSSGPKSSQAGSSGPNGRVGRARGSQEMPIDIDLSPDSEIGDTGLTDLKGKGKAKDTSSMPRPAQKHGRPSIKGAKRTATSPMGKARTKTTRDGDNAADEPPTKRSRPDNSQEDNEVMQGGVQTLTTKRISPSLSVERGTRAAPRPSKQSGTVRPATGGGMDRERRDSTETRDAIQRTLATGKHLSYGSLVADEVTFRRKEALGVAGRSSDGRTLSQPRAAESSLSMAASGRSCLLDLVPTSTSNPMRTSSASSRPSREDMLELGDGILGEAAQGGNGKVHNKDHGRAGMGDDQKWVCLVCTL